MKFEETALQRDWEISKEQSCVDVADDDATPSDAALGALLEDAEPSDADAERRVRRLGSRLARLDALNVAGMLAAATESGGAGAALAERLGDGLGAGAALAARLRRYDALARAAPAAPHARSDAARADTNARRLLAELAALFAWLDAAPLRELDALAEVSLAAPEGRARALAAAEALRAALRAEAAAPAALRRLAAVRERLRRLARAKDQLAAALARHLNNALIHLGNEAGEARASRHHAELLPYAPFMRWLKDMDDKAFEGLARVYTGTWARRHERELRAACDAARAALAQAPPDRADEPLDAVLSLVESMCNAEQDFCTQFFFLDIDVKGEAGEAEAERGEARRAGAETRRFMCELFPALESELVALVAHVERHDPYGAMRALACVGRRVLGAAEGGAGGGAGAGGEARWARAALAGVAVAAKRGADRCVADRLAALPDAVKQAAKKPKCGLLSFLQELEELSGACERIFVSSGRRADLDRWYVSLASAMLQAVQHAEHPRTPRAVLHMENYHRLHAVLSALRVPALEALRRECRTRYSDALRAYVTQYFGRPLEKLTQFFEGVSEAVAQGVREDEVCYRAAFSKHELRRVLAMYPAHEVRKSLHRLYRTVEKHLSEEGGLLQVVWRAMQEEFIAQHVALQARIAACYPAAGLALPLTTQHILDAFSDIAREH
ncbi:exocyst complex component 1 isoform X6 [Helicoverpa zea]|uniref:exocyst complex component 1 isoform X6 n=1 Tax=Helicoverpa zea TaxID=7113 RepID=UPI001F56C1F5|nr:exocyst complex component 1 isoform X6 [Helicoverpa zea]